MVGDGEPVFASLGILGQIVKGADGQSGGAGIAYRNRLPDRPLPLIGKDNRGIPPCEESVLNEARLLDGLDYCGGDKSIVFRVVSRVKNLIFFIPGYVEFYNCCIIEIGYFFLAGHNGQPDHHQSHSEYRRQ